MCPFSLPYEVPHGQNKTGKIKGVYRGIQKTGAPQGKLCAMYMGTLLKCMDK